MLITQGLGNSTLVTAGLGESSPLDNPPGTFYVDPVDPRKSQFGKGIRMGNVPRGKADFVVVHGTQIFHVNNVQNFPQDVSERLTLAGEYSGAVKFRFRSYRSFPVPRSVNKTDGLGVDQFSNPVFSFTGR